VEIPCSEKSAKSETSNYGLRFFTFFWNAASKKNVKIVFSNYGWQQRHFALTGWGLYSSDELIYYPIHRGTGYCFRSISLFVYMFICIFLSFFVSLLAKLRENGWTEICIKFSGKVWSDHGGTTWLPFLSIPRNRAMPRCATRGRGLLCWTFCPISFLKIFQSLLIKIIRTQNLF